MCSSHLRRALKAPLNLRVEILCQETAVFLPISSVRGVGELSKRKFNSDAHSRPPFPVNV